MTISQRILQIMKEKAVSAKKLSEYTGISTSAISDWKYKQTTPSAEKLPIIAECLNVPICKLFGINEISDCTMEFHDVSTAIESQNIFNNDAVCIAYHNLSVESQLEIQLEILKRSKTDEK